MKNGIQNIIIGAGLAGLAAAYRLKKNFRIIERSDHAGGLCDTEQLNGFRFDRTGHLLHLRKGPVRNTVLRLLDEAPLEIERQARIFSHGTYTRYPFQANTFGLPKDVVSECLTGFIDAQVGKATDHSSPPSFEAFILRHFGEGIAKHFMIPYNAKLWGVHPKDVTSDWCRRFVPVPDVPSVVEGALGVSKKQMGYNARFFYPKNGISALPRAFERRIKKIEYHTQPDAVDLKKRRVHIDGEWIPYRHLINTIPLSSFLDLVISPMPKGIGRAASTLQCTKLKYLNVGLKRPCGTDHHWTYVPEKKFPFYRIGCYTNFSAALAPAHKSSLYVELTSRGPIRLESLMPKVTQGLIEMGIIKNASDIEFALPREIPHAYVVYNFDYSKSVAKLRDWLENHGVFSAGRYAVWEYAAMEDAISQGFDAADRIKDLA